MNSAIHAEQEALFNKWRAHSLPSIKDLGNIVQNSFTEEFQLDDEEVKDWSEVATGRISSLVSTAYEADIKTLLRLQKETLEFLRNWGCNFTVELDSIMRQVAETHNAQLEKTIEVPLWKWRELIKNDYRLALLDRGSVDGWDWYGESLWETSDVANIDDFGLQVDRGEHDDPEEFTAGGLVGV